MKRLLQCAVACGVVLSLVAMATAQPVPVTRMGDWVEIGDDAFMNIIGNIDIRYQTTDEWDFESDIQERMNTRLGNASTAYVGEGDFMQAEVRWGADFRYKKVLRTRVLFEAQQIFDGNRIDDRQNSNTPENGPAGPNSIGSIQQEDGSPHVERFWIEYKFLPQVRMRVGSDLWALDGGRWLADDDPRFAIYIKPQDNLEFVAAAVIQSESARLGLTNDNDDVYYTWGGNYKTGPHTIGLHGAYFRWRFDNTQRADTILIMPHVKGTVPGSVPIEYLVQFGGVFGTVDDMRDGTGGDDYDVAGYAAVASVRLSLVGGVVRPFLHVFFGSGDDDADDSDLNGFMTLPQNEITLLSGGGIYSDFAPTSRLFDGWGPAAGARASIGGGNLGGSTTGNWLNDRLGNGAHGGTTAAYSNAGTLRLVVGVSLYPISGHRFSVWYTYDSFLEDEMLRNAAGVSTGVGSIDKDLVHEISGVWHWTLNSHFDIRLRGSVFVPGEGTKDIAETVSTCGNGTQQCDGDDIALLGSARFRARF